MGASTLSTDMTDAREPAPERPRGQAVVIAGASAGGVEALVHLVSSLPADFPHAMLIVLHVSPSGTSVLPAILARACPLPVCAPADGEELSPGHVYVAPPDSHLVVEDSHLRLSQAPRENGHRPAIDPTMRTAANAYGGATIGIVLSGSRDDGTAGLIAIKARGGIAIVQDPEEALYPAMPLSAIAHVEPDAVLPVAAMARWILEHNAQTNRAPMSSQSPTNPPAPPTPATPPLRSTTASGGRRHRGRPAGVGDGRWHALHVPGLRRRALRAPRGPPRALRVQRRARLLDREPVERPGRCARERAVGRRPLPRGPRRSAQAPRRRRPGRTTSCARRSRSSVTADDAFERARTIRETIQNSSDDRAIAAES